MNEIVDRLMLLHDIAARRFSIAAHGYPSADLPAEDARATLRAELERLFSAEPVAWLVYDGSGFNPGPVKMGDADVPLHAAPQPVTDTQDSYTALGFAYTWACSLLDHGLDPRKVEVPELVQQWKDAQIAAAKEKP